MDANTALQQTRQHFRHLNLELPAALRKELDDIDAVLTKSAPVIAGKDTLVTATWDAIAAGKDILADKTITTELMAGLLAQQNLGSRLRQHADALRAQALTRHADKILDSMAQVVDAADDAFTAAHTAISNLDITEETSVTNINPLHASTWALAREAARRLDSVGQVWICITQACGLAPIPRDMRERTLIFLNLDLDDFDALSINHHTPSAWTAAIAHSGRHLDYATPIDFIERRQAINEERAERAAELAKERQEAGFGPIPQRIR